MHVLVLNSGSSSLKFQLFQMPDAKVLAGGQVEKIGQDQSDLSIIAAAKQFTEQFVARDHKAALQRVIELLRTELAIINSFEDIDAVGHRVVHGGARFFHTTQIDSTILSAIKDLSPLAPLHNPANATGIEVAQQLFTKAAQVAVFDTAFYHDMPDKARNYAINPEFADKHDIRVYGFHGISHEYVSIQTQQFLQNEKARVVNLHLGNGCSATAIYAGRPIDHSMGFGPLTGLVMGTRSGDIDPSIIFYLMEQQKMTAAEVKQLLTKESGMLGLTGYSDLREIEALAVGGNTSAKSALELNAYRIQKYIGAYTIALGGLDALVFTAGIGENSATMRERVCKGLSFLGIDLDPELNSQRLPGIRTISSDQSKVPVLIVPTNEELSIAQKVWAILK